MIDFISYCIFGLHCVALAADLWSSNRILLSPDRSYTILAGTWMERVKRWFVYDVTIIALKALWGAVALFLHWSLGPDQWGAVLGFVSIIAYGSLLRGNAAIMKTEILRRQ